MLSAKNDSNAHIIVDINACPVEVVANAVLILKNGLASLPLAP